MEEDTKTNPNIETKVVETLTMFLLFMFIITLIWWTAGFIGFLMSIVCCFYNGSTTDKFLGILLAWILGPFYWLFFIYNSSYCTRFNQPHAQQPYYE
jgi:hypothetical protein